MPKTQRISSSATLPLKLFLPVFWSTFFGAFALAFTLTPEAEVGFVSRQVFSTALLIFLATGLLFFWLTVFRLKRVEVDSEFLYATNYFKTYKYPYHNIASIQERDWGLFHTLHLRFKTPGRFGKGIYFLVQRARLAAFLAEHPDLAPLFGLKAEAGQ